MQTSISSAELRPYLETVRKRIAKNSTNPIWEKLEDRWLLLVQTAQEHVERIEAGTPYVRYHREAWSDLARLGKEVQPREVIETILAVYLMEGWNPRRFVDDRAFGFQLVRRVRSLSTVAVAEYHDFKSGKQKKVYRDFKPKTCEYLASILKTTFGVAGLAVARLEARDRQQQEADKQSFFDHLSALQ